LDRLSAQLVSLVRETMEPASVGLWLYQADREASGVQGKR
jgi:hypothetical protein